MATISTQPTDEGDEIAVMPMSTAEMANMEMKLREIWASALGQKLSEIPVDRDMIDFADSLVVVKISASVLKEMHLDLSCQDIYDHRTIQEQASALELNRLFKSLHRPRSVPTPVKRAPSPRSERDRIFPPHIFYGLPHLYYGPCGIASSYQRQNVNEGFTKTKDASNQALAEFGLSWADVEDVLPMTNISSYMFRNRERAQSWVFRTTLTSTKTCEQVIAALKTVLENHPILRTVAIWYEGKPLHVVVRPNPKWLGHLVVTEKEVEDPEELKNLLLLDPKMDTKPYAVDGGPLFRAIVTHVKSTGTAGIIIIASHACLDAISVSLFQEDIATCLALGPQALKPHSSYKLYVCNYTLHRDDSIAEEGCHYFSQLLHGISEHENASWPPQPHPESNIFRGSCYPWWKDTDRNKKNPSERQILDGIGNERGIEGLSYTIDLPHLKVLRDSYGISSPIVLKAAVVLFNISQTGANEAHFGLPDAGRSWPFIQEYCGSEQTQACDPAIDINGPTWEFCFDRVSVTEDETVLGFLERLQSAQYELSFHAHTPLDMIFSTLSSEDLSTVQKVMSRQVLNWYPDLLKESFGPPDQPPVLTRIQLHVNSPSGYVWSGAMYRPETMMLNGSYDDAQYHADEVRRWITKALSAVEWLCSPENWAATVGECKFESENVVSWG